MQRLYKYNGSVLCPNLDIVCGNSRDAGWNAVSMLEVVYLVAGLVLYQ